MMVILFNCKVLENYNKYTLHKLLKNNFWPGWAVVVHIFKPQHGERERQADICELKTRLVYTASSKTARVVTRRNRVSKQTNKQETP